MKKLLVLSLAIVMMFAMATTCFAAVEKFDAVGSKSADVKVTYVAGQGAPDTYAVDVTWGDMTFVYTQSAQQWDAVNHVEVDAATSGWTHGSATIEVKNHSNVAVSSTIAYAAGTASGTASFTLTGGETTTLAAATPAAQATQTATLTASGVPATNAEAVTVGTVTVTIAAPAAAQ